MNGKQRLTFLILLFFIQLHSIAQPLPSQQNDLRLWFNHPASDWNEALPIGNGRLGAMIFGGVLSERLQLNEETVWAGKPADFVNPEAKKALPTVRKLLFAGKYVEAQKMAQEKMMGDKTVPSSYQTLGDLHLDFGENIPGSFTNYYRDLNLETAIATVSYKLNKTTFHREMFSSAPGQALVIRLTADEAEALSFTLQLTRPGNKASISVKEQEVTMHEHVGDGTGVNMVTRVKVIAEGGNIRSTEKSIVIEKANTVTLLITAATDYRGTDPFIVSGDQLRAAEKKSYEQLKKDHIADYQQYFKRVDLDLGETNSVHFPTDTRIAALQKGNTDPQLAELYYQFGRYLLISSSRPGTLPANLQGIWADGLNPPWSADYHININIQMNYWLAEMTNLSELHMPFIEFLDNLRADGRKTAAAMYGVKGTVAHFTTDAWHFTEPYGQTQWAMWPMGMAWSVQHAWEHYLFTEDKEYLKNTAYPIMKEAAEFCANWLVEDPATKQLVSGPSISPENRFRTKSGEVATMVMGPTMDHMIIRNLLSNTIGAAQVLDTDAAFRKRLEKIMTRLAPTKIGSDGRILEWTEEFEEPEPGHRHISHLFGLHPGNEITRQKSPELLEAARKTIAHRLSHGGGHTGWSRAWIINFYARLQDGEEAHKNLVALFQKSTLPNLFDNHPPFQIDGNFGATAGITEMLLQSHAGEIHLLPALPVAWNKGYIRGICARGGFVLDLEWENGKLKQAKVLSNLGNTCRIRYGEQVITLNTEKGKLYNLDEVLRIQR